MILLKPPLQLTQEQLNTGNISVFLAGSIEMGKAEDWQSEVQNILKDSDVTIFSPRRDDWNCVDNETKAITKTGIKCLDELSEGDLILTFNNITNTLEYQPILKINAYNVVSASISKFIRNDEVFLFTNNHIHVDRSKNKNKNSIFKKSSDYTSGEGRVRVPCGKKLVENVSNTTEDYAWKAFNHDHIKLCAWILSEGSIFNSNGKRMITLAQSYEANPHKVSRIKNILQNLNITYRFYNNQFILDKDAVDFILGVLQLEKYKIPTWIKTSRAEEKRIFINEYAIGDGCFREDKLLYIAYSEKYIKFAEEMQILAYEAGLSTKMRNKTSGFGHPVVNINFHNCDKSGFSYKYDSEHVYTGTLWCPTTENATWVAYRNGTPFITGNSSWPQDASFQPFNEQVSWELDHIDQADMILMYFDPDTKSPITLLELGLLTANADKVLVCCPEGYWRKGNVDIVCQRYGISQVDTKEDFFDFVKSIAIEISNTPSIDMSDDISSTD